MSGQYEGKMIPADVDKVVISDGQAVLYRADCRDILPTLGKVDAIITDPPYPDYHEELYEQCDIDFLKSLDCLQLIFWSARTDFPLDYTAIHIWDKRTGTGCQYERIYERNGSTAYKVIRGHAIFSPVAAKMARDEVSGHPSNKPQTAMRELVSKWTKPYDTILDCFMGGGSTGVAALKLGRKFIGVEIDPGYFRTACQRIQKEADQLKLF